MHKAKHIILDFDNVTAATEAVFADFDRRRLNSVLEQAGAGQRLGYEEIRALAGHSGEEKFDWVGNRYRLDLEAYRDSFIRERNAARETLFRDITVPLGKNLKLFLSRLAHTYALATNKMAAKLFPDMNLMGIADLFPVIVTCEPPLRKKPAPDILLKAASDMGATPGECAYIGDNTLDMQAAKAAGMKAVGFIIEGKTERAEQANALLESGAEIVIDDFMDLQLYVECS